MINILEQIGEMGALNVVMGASVVCLLAVGLVSLKDEVFKKFGIMTKRALQENETNKRILDAETKIKDMEKRLVELHDELERKQNAYEERLSGVRTDLSAQLQAISEMLTAFMKRTDENTVAQFRSTLWRMHKDFTTQNFVTPDGLKTFLEMGKVYEQAGGNDIYHEKLLPEVEALEIHYPSGGVYNR